MSSTYLPAREPSDWKTVLASRGHWRPGHSAWALAHSWQAADGFPPEVGRALRDLGVAAFRKIELVFASPEYKTPLPGRGKDSHNDVLVVARGSDGLVVIAVEGKVDEGFGVTVSKWLGNPEKNVNRAKRLAYLLDRLHLRQERVRDIPYQLLHRAVSALIEAERLCARNAMMLVHSFCEKDTGFAEYKRFVSVFQLVAEPNRVVGPAKLDDVDLYFGWVCGERRFLR